MPTEPRKPEGKAVGCLQPEVPGTAAANPPETHGQPEEFPPTGLTVTDTWAETADASGTVASSRTMPEPDSLGG